MAAARKVSPAASDDPLRRPRWARRVSLAIEVVLPTPLTPTTRVSEGRGRTGAAPERRAGARRPRRTGACAARCVLPTCSWRRSSAPARPGRARSRRPRSAVISTSSRYSNVRSSRVTLPCIAELIFSMISVWVMKRPRFSFLEEASLLGLLFERTGLRSELEDVVLRVVLSHTGPYGAILGEQFPRELRRRFDHGRPGAGDERRVALDEHQVIAVRQRHRVDVDRLLLDVDQPGLAHLGRRSGPSRAGGGRSRGRRPPPASGRECSPHRRGPRSRRCRRGTGRRAPGRCWRADWRGRTGTSGSRSRSQVTAAPRARAPAPARPRNARRRPRTAARTSPASKARRKAVTILASKRLPVEAGDRLDGELQAVGFLIRPVGGDGVERVGHAHDAGVERDLLAPEAVRIAAAVPGLVVRPDGRDRLAELLDRRHDLGADHRVRLHLLELFFRELARLAQDLVLDADLADVVQQRADPDLVLHVLGRARESGRSTRLTAATRSEWPRV